VQVCDREMPNERRAPRDPEDLELTALDLLD
jgi:hypothetical protein